MRDAVRQGHTQVARKLRAHGGDLGFSEVEASGELCELARQGSLDLLRVMLECGVAINAADCAWRHADSNALQTRTHPIIEYSRHKAPILSRGSASQMHVVYGR